MSFIKYILFNIIETIFRGFPFPCRTGLIKIGNPNENSPVFLTCNFHLTVERVKRALRGSDAYLLVANSKGINVWCGSAGGLFNNHNVISVLKTSSISELVEHRKIILPQLSATGIEAKVVKKATGWNITWGPVYAKDIQAFLSNNSVKTSQMHRVEFPLVQRLEMAIMWAFPFAIIVGLITFFVWRKMFIPATSLVFGLPFLIFLLFPLYKKLLNPRKRGTFISKYTVVFDLSLIPLLLWFCFLLIQRRRGLR